MFGKPARHLDPRDLQAYFDKLRASAEKDLEGLDDVFIERLFEAAESGGRLPAHELLRYHGLFRERKPDLGKVLELSRVVILGEPGAGKSTVASMATKQLSERRDANAVPVVVRLKTYGGDLPGLLDQISPAVLHAPNLRRVYLFDGLDEIDRSKLAAFSPDLQRLADEDPGAHIVVTSRQAFFVEHDWLIPFTTAVLHILDFSDEDIRRYLAGHGVPVDGFLRAVSDVDCRNEITNPLVLKVMAHRYAEHGQLSALKSDNICFMIDELLQRRHSKWPSRYRRAIRMFAVAMETASRNELTLDEAREVISISMGENQGTVDTLIYDLLNSVLVRTESGLSFQMRSYGEYLAAEELQNQSIDRIRDLAFFEGGQPNESWMNTISYLAELNPSVRRYFARNHPHWLLMSSPGAFEHAEKRSMVEAVLARIDEEAAYLLDHPLVRPLRVAKFLIGDTIEHLRKDLVSDRAYRLANALLLLGLRRDPAVVPSAFPIALDTSRNDPVRYCAIVALGNTETAGLLDAILPALQTTDSFHASLADCAGALCTAADIERVLPAILATDTTLSSALSRFHELRSREALVGVLRFLVGSPPRLNDIRIESYIGPILKSLPDFQEDEIIELCTRLLVCIEDADLYTDRNGIWPLLCTVLGRSARKAEICRGVLRELLNRGKVPRWDMDALLADLLDAQTAEWLIEQNATPMIQQLSYRVPAGEIRELLGPHSGGSISAQDEHRRQYQEEEAKKEAAEDQATEASQQRIRASGDFIEVLNTLHGLKEEQWPELNADRLRWLADEVSRFLVSMDLERSIVYESENSWRQPPALRLMLKLVDRYGFAISDDRHLVLALKAWTEGVVSSYFKRHRFSAGAVQEFETQLRDRSNANVSGHLLNFLQQTDLNSLAIQEALQAIARQDEAAEFLRITALDLLAKRGAPDAFFDGLRFAGERAVAQKAFTVLVERQHRPTIERALSQLLADDARLRSAEVPFPDMSPLDWIGGIRAEFAWDKLKRVRRKTLELNLDRLASVVTETMAKVDRARLAHVVREQLPFAPEAWRRFQAVRAMEYERDARLLGAQAAPFERVIRKLKATTSMLALKLWCEGSTDRPVFRRFLGEMGLGEIARTVDVIGGWSQLPKREPDRLKDGYRAAVVVMDGDVGRNLRKKNKPETKEAKKARQLLATSGVTLHVLERYGIENYFTEGACSDVLQRDLSAYFPIPDWARIAEHFAEPRGKLDALLMWLGRAVGGPWGGRSFFHKSEDLYEAIASRMTLADIEATDLYQVLGDVQQQAERLAAT